jgi:predicted acylesterase/phospholipase RssA
MNTVKHLVISGGSFKGIAFLGVIECLQRNQKLKIKQLETLAGSSVGAIIACFLVVGYNVAEIFKLILDTNFQDLVDVHVSKLLTNFGLDSGHRLVTVIKNCFIAKGFDPDITFEQLYAKTQQRLVITASCLGKGVTYFDYLSHPDLSVVVALRMSFGIPFLFTAVKYQGDYYVDGGLLDNCPMTILSKESPDSIIIIRASYRHQQPQLRDAQSAEPKEIDPETYLWLLMSTTLGEIERLRLSATRQLQSLSTIVVPTSELKIASMVSITKVEKERLFKAGYLAAKKYLDSDAWLTLRVHSMPYHIMRQIWQSVHRKSFALVLRQLPRGDE